MTLSVDRIQGLSGSLAIKRPVACATTANITLNGLQTIDGFVLASGDRVLVKNQTTGSENGVYEADTSDWRRTLDFDKSNDVVHGTLVNVIGGSTNYGLWIQSAAAPVVGTSSLVFERFEGFEGSDQVVYVPAGTGAVSTTVQTKLRESVSVLDFGAIGNGVADCTDALQKAITYLSSIGGGTINFPDGEYLFSADSATIVLASGGITFKGQSENGTRIVMEEADGDDVAKQFFNMGYSATNRSRIDVVDLTFEGTMFNGTGVKGAASATPFIFGLYAVEQATISRCTFKSLGYGGPLLQNVDNVLMEGCTFVDLAKTSTRIVNARKVRFINNHIERVGDDVLSAHVGAGNSGLTPLKQEGIVISNNVARACAGSLKALGGTVITCTGNILQLTEGIQLGGAATSEGTQQTPDIIVTDNIVLDSFRIAGDGTSITNSGIYVYLQTPRGTAASSSTIPGRWNGSAFEYPWDHRDSRTDLTVDAISPAVGVKISGNIVRRTLPNVSDITDWGYGDLNSQGEYKTFAADDTNMRPTFGLQFTNGGVWHSSIVDNEISHCLTAIGIPQSFEGRNITIENNRMTDCITSGFTLGAPVSGMSSIVIRNNFMDLDPYRINANSDNDGTYTDPALGPTAFSISGLASGIWITGNRIQNAGRVLQAETNRNYYKDNDLYVGSGYVLGSSTSNVGIGHIPTVNGFNITTVNADPTSSTYLATAPTVPSHTRVLATDADATVKFGTYDAVVAYTGGVSTITLSDPSDTTTAHEIKVTNDRAVAISIAGVDKGLTGASNLPANSTVTVYYVPGLGTVYN